MKLSAGDVPDPEPEAVEGRLAVTVLQDDEPVTSEAVFVVSEASGATEQSGLSANGLALFELPPGEYRVVVADELRNTTVRAFETVAVTVEIES